VAEVLFAAGIPIGKLQVNAGKKGTNAVRVNPMFARLTESQKDRGPTKKLVVGHQQASAGTKKKKKKTKKRGRGGEVFA